MLGLSFPPFPFAPLAWIALVPLLLLWTEEASSRSAFLDAYGTFLGTFAIAFHWPLFHINAETALLSFPPLLVVPMWMAVPFGLSHLLRRRTGMPAAAAALVALFVLMEWGLRRGPFAFPWTLLGHTQADFAPISSLARIGGVPLLTTFVLAMNVFCLFLIERRRGATLTAAALGLCAVIAAVWPRTDVSPERSLRVGLVQPAIPADEWADLDDVRRVDVLLALSDTIAARVRRTGVGVDLVVWPETSLPPGDVPTRRRVQGWVDAHEVPVLTGEIASGTSPSGTAVFYNAARLLRPSRPGLVYRKRRLVPFAEHVPFQDRWPWVRRLAVPSGGVPGYARGRSGDLMEIPEARFGVLICFETLFDDAARAYARRGADLIVTITQDGWWGASFGYRQHLAFTRLRAVETGMPVVQVSVSGISAVVGPGGAIDGRIGWMEREAALGVVQIGGGRTPYLTFGDWVSPVALAAAMLTVVVALISRRS